MEGVSIVSRRREAVISLKCDLGSVERESNIQCFRVSVLLSRKRSFLVKTAALSRKCLCRTPASLLVEFLKQLKAQNALLLRVNLLSRAGAEKVSLHSKTRRLGPTIFIMY